MSAYQSIGRSFQNIKSTDSTVPDTQFYSSDSRMLTSITPAHVDLSNGCVNVPDFSAGAVLPSTTAEVPIPLPSPPQYPMESNYSGDGYSSYLQSADLDTSIPFLNTPQMDNDLSIQSWNMSAFIEDCSAAVNGNLPLSPVSMVGPSSSPQTYTSLPAPMVSLTKTTYGYQDDLSNGASPVYNDTIYPTTRTYIEEPQNERSDLFRRISCMYQISVLTTRCTGLWGIQHLTLGPCYPLPWPRNQPVKPRIVLPLSLHLMMVVSQDPMMTAVIPIIKPSLDQMDNTTAPLQLKRDANTSPPRRNALTSKSYINIHLSPLTISRSKYLDSHLKPYRCKAKNAPQCAEARFSSTACRLRHEREAHGLHGHGKMPHLCQYEGCDRAAPDNGFPRRWNLFDHMKRVHAWTQPESGLECSSPEDECPVNSQPRVDKKINGEKRKKVTKPPSHPMKKTRSGMSNQGHQAAKSRSQIQQEQALLSIKQKWDDCQARIRSQYRSLELGDDHSLAQLLATTQELHTLDIQYRRAKAGQAATFIAGYA
jgi:hypothetical protein